MDPRRIGAVTLLIACAVALVSALTLPTVTFTTIASDDEIYSILSGVASLWDDGNWILATIVFAFSVVFPSVKLMLLGLVLVRHGAPARRARVTRFFERHGKWSMLDVFVVAAFVGSIRLGLLANATSRVGIHVFAGAVIASMLCTQLVVRLECPRHDHPEHFDPWRPVSRIVSTISAFAVIACWFLPVLLVQKALLFRNDVSLIPTTERLLHADEVLLAITIALFVLLIPTARAVMMLRLRWMPGGTPRAARIAVTLGEWGMLDVFALALVLVIVKLDELAAATPLVGYWVILGAGLIAQLDGWLLRSELKH